MPQVSVIMPVYNGERFVAEAIDSILAQTFSDFEFIIVDDGSQDNSAQIIQYYQKRHKRIRFFQHERNMGSADARNSGIVNASGEYIAMMDCDDISLPQRLEKQVAFLRSSPEVGAAGVCAQIVNRDLSPLLLFDVPRRHALIAFNLFHGASLVGASVMYGRETLLAVGAYEPGRRNSSVHDLELNLRLLQKTAIRFANLPDRLYVYRRHDHSLSAAAKAGDYVKEREVRRRMLQALGQSASPDTIERFQRLRFQQKLTFGQRRAAKTDLKRLIESLIEHQLVDASDKPLLLAEMNRRLEETTPRRWQQFCHWRRHRFPRFFPDPLQDQQ